MARSVKTTDLRTVKVVPYLQEQPVDDWFDITFNFEEELMFLDFYDRNMYRVFYNPAQKCVKVEIGYNEEHFRRYSVSHHECDDWVRHYIAQGAPTKSLST